MEHIVLMIVGAFVAGVVGENILNRHRLTKALYNPNGTTIYIPREEFFKVQSQCQQAVCKKIDELKIALADANRIRDDARVEHAQFYGMVMKSLEDIEKELARLRTEN